MKKHVVWQPHVEADPPLNPFVPPVSRNKPEELDLDRAHRSELEVGDDEISGTSGAGRLI